MEEMQSGEIKKLIDWLREHGHTDAEIIECIETITSK